MYRINQKDVKIKALLQEPKKVFRTSDLAVLWSIQNKNTLWTTVKRYVAKGLLHRIHKGLYSKVEIDKLHPYELGCALCGPLAYVTTETVLVNEGILMQSVPHVTLMGEKKQDFQINGVQFICRSLNKKYLVNRVGILYQDNYSIATIERALADMKHISPQYYFDNQNQEFLQLADNISKEIGYK